MKVEISIIIPVFNGEQTLEKCVESIFQQSYPYCEVIVINDGSTDDTELICETFLDKYPERFSYENKKNQGVSAARNRGIEMAKGAFIQFVDADDTVHPNYSKNMIEAIECSDLVISGYAVTSNQKTIEFVFQKADQFFYHDFLENIFELIYPKNQIFSPCNKLYRSSLLKNNEIRFQNDKKIGEDAQFNLSYIQYCKSITLVEECLYFYEKGSATSAMSNFGIEWFESNLNITCTIKKLLTNEGIAYEKLTYYPVYRDYLGMMFLTRLLTFKKNQNYIGHIQSIYSQLKVTDLWEISNINLRKKSLRYFIFLVETHHYRLSTCYCLFFRILIGTSKKIKKGREGMAKKWK